MFEFTCTCQNIDRKKSPPPICPLLLSQVSSSLPHPPLLHQGEKNKNHHRRSYFSVSYFHSAKLAKITDSPPHRRRHCCCTRRFIHPCCRHRLPLHTLPHQKKQNKTPSPSLLFCHHFFLLRKN